jgi:hypothetical protein
MSDDDNNTVLSDPVNQTRQSVSQIDDEDSSLLSMSSGAPVEPRTLLLYGSSRDDPDEYEHDPDEDDDPHNNRHGTFPMLYSDVGYEYKPKFGSHDDFETIQDKLCHPEFSA